MKDAKTFFDRNPLAFRIFFLIVALPLIWSAGNQAYSILNKGADESGFREAVSRLYVFKDVQAFKVVKVKRTYLTLTRVDRGWIRAGDLIKSINGIEVKTAEDVQQVLAQCAGMERIRIEVQRPTRPDYYLEFEILARYLPKKFIMEIAPSVFVWDVPQGGLSDKAGLKSGDLIHQINGHNFNNQQEAERIVSRTLRGQTVTYNILRNGRNLELQVPVVRLSIPFSLVFYQLTGFLWIFVGLGLALARANLKAARLLGLGIFALGVSFLLFENGGLHAENSLPIRLGVALLYVGVAFLLHVSYYFPRERRALLRFPLYRHGSYIILTVAVVWALLGGTESLAPCLSAFFGVHLGIRILNRGRRSREQETLERFIVFGAWFTLLTAGGWFLLRGRLPETWDLLLRAVPALILLCCYVYTINRFRLLGLSMARSLQYPIVVILWTLFTLFVFVLTLQFLSTSDLPKFNISLSSRQIEIHELTLDPALRIQSEKLMLMVLSVFVAWALFKIMGHGLNFLRRKFHRTSYDDRLASHELTALLSNRQSMQELAQGIVARLARLMMLKRVGLIVFRDDHTISILEAWGLDSPQWDSFCREQGHFIARTLQKFRSELCVDYLNPNIKDQLVADGFKYIYPLYSGDRMLGCLLMGEKLSETAYRPEDFQFLAVRASQVATAIENAYLYEKLSEQERLKQELELARAIQVSSLPQAEPVVGNLDIAGASIPALEVGGDYYAYFQETPSDLTVIVGDVSGKGMSAAMYMSKLQGIFSALHGNGYGPRELFLKANPILYREMDKQAFVTATCAQFHGETRLVSFSRAGHVPLFQYISKSGQVVSHQPDGLGLGIEDKGTFVRLLREQNIEYCEGDVFLFISDGVTESFSPDKQAYGDARVMDILKNNANKSAREILDAIVEDLYYFTSGGVQDDDQTLVVVKIVG